MIRTIPAPLRGWLVTFAIATLTSTMVYVLPQELHRLIEKRQIETQGIPEFDWSDW